ncbi:hypothetical protein TcasGA2_TC004180 [Tribolium castaneum]|uniref:Peptidase A2 domain-containing protein n=1 Tax=Tribolium castaneum TaxID=7070 RepID=D7EKZ7_TRICA|nr:hypothetical protein TcasGA2_TC004180 [Tribolium castaneum]
MGLVLKSLMEKDIGTSFEKMVETATNKMTALEMKREVGNSTGKGKNGEPVAAIAKDSEGTISQGRHEIVSMWKNHVKDKCFHKNTSCFVCEERGYLAAFCKNVKNKEHSRAVNYKVQDSEDSSGDEDQLSLFKIQSNGKAPHYVTLKILGSSKQFEIDSGSSASVISLENYKKNLARLKLCKVYKCLSFYDETKVKPVGMVKKVKVTYNGVDNYLDFHVMENGGPPIVGRDFLENYYY